MVAHPLVHLIDQPVPDITLPSSLGGELSFRSFVGRRPLALFFYILNGTPG